MTLRSGLAVVVFSFCAGCAGSTASEEPARAPAPAGAPPSSSASSASGDAEVGVASYYADSLAGRRTASGERYTPTDMTAAHKTLPFGTLVEVRRDDGRVVIVRVNDRGPFKKGRVIDLSRRAAEELGIVRRGVALVSVRIVQLAPAKPKRR